VRERDWATSWTDATWMVFGSELERTIEIPVLITFPKYPAGHLEGLKELGRGQWPSWWVVYTRGLERAKTRFVLFLPFFPFLFLEVSPDAASSFRRGPSTSYSRKSSSEGP